MTLRIQYGGSFDPVHSGHLAVARAARDRLRGDVWLMPAADPPHKPPTAATAVARREMLELAVAGHAGLHVDDRELRRAGPSWTIDTLRGMRAELGDERPIALLLGADSFIGLPGWREWESLLAHAHVVVAERPGSVIDPDALPSPLTAHVEGRWRESMRDLHARPSGLLLRLCLPLRPESSSELRRRIGAGESWQGWVPPAVASYIVRNRLYGAS